MSEQTKSTAIPGWVWGMLVGLVIFGAGYFIGDLGGDETVDATGGGTITATAPDSDVAPDSETVSDSSAASDSDAETLPEAVDSAPEDGEDAVPPVEAETSGAPPAQFSDLPPVLVTELPGEAIDTLDLIASSGPYPFDRDGLTFQNREGFLPDHPRGHYQEFTVITPGESTRGARRIVAGADGELYYTSDHYASFREIVYED